MHKCLFEYFYEYVCRRVNSLFFMFTILSVALVKKNLFSFFEEFFTSINIYLYFLLTFWNADRLHRPTCRIRNTIVCVWPRTCFLCSTCHRRLSSRSSRRPICPRMRTRARLRSTKTDFYCSEKTHIVIFIYFHRTILKKY